MSDLISKSKQEVIDEIRSFQDQVTLSSSSDWINGMDEGFNHAVSVIELMDTVEAEPVRHGKWILKQEKVNNISGHWNRWSCSYCGYVRTKGWATTLEGHKPNALFCENCGAKMDERKEE